jgi:uncharacterized protein (TIGR03437 family)
MQERRIFIAKLLIPIGVLPVLLLGYALGPPPGHTGAPGEQTCWAIGCHNTPTGAFFENSNAIALAFPGAQTYEPGVTQRLRVTVTDPQGRVFGFQLSVRDGENRQAGTLAPADARTRLEALQGITYIEHAMPQADGVFQFDWTPPATNVGPITFYVAANAANNDFNPTGDRIHTRRFTVQAAASNAPQIRPELPVLQAFDNSQRMSAGTYIQIFGQNLAQTTRQWAEADFNQGRAPTELDGVRVNVNGRPAFVNYISPTQVNALTPEDDATGPVNVEVINANGTSNAAAGQKSRISPAMLADSRFRSGDRDYVVAFFPDFTTFVGPEGLVTGAAFRPARPGETIIIYALGCGPSNPATPVGQIPSENRPLALPFEFRIGNVAAQAQGVVLGQFLSLYQFNVTVPEVPDGDARIELTVDGQSTGQTLFLAVRR